MHFPAALSISLRLSLLLAFSLTGFGFWFVTPLERIQVVALDTSQQLESST